MPNIRRITVDSTPAQLRQREQDTKDTIERTAQNLKNVASVQAQTNEKITNLKRQVKDGERTGRKAETSTHSCRS